MTVTFTKATKQQGKLRLALFAPSGGGKTFTALRIATGIGGPIGVIDTERNSACKYADRFDFNVLNLEDHSIEAYCAAIEAAKGAGIKVLIIDSLTHAWKQLLDQVEKLAQAKYRGNTWSAWSEGTPLQNTLIDAFLSFDGHIIATMRSKTEWTIEKDERGKTKPMRVGLAPDQGKGIEYEFDMLIEMTTDHIANVLKDRTGKFQDHIIDKPGEDFGKAVAAWLSEGTAYVAPEPKKNDAAQPSEPGAEEFGWLQAANGDKRLQRNLKALGYKKPDCDRIWAETDFTGCETNEDKALRFGAVIDGLMKDIKF